MVSHLRGILKSVNKNSSEDVLMPTIKAFVAALLTILALSVHAQVYTWVDENGVKHYGDRIPEKFRQSANQVDANWHEPSADELAEARTRVNATKPNRRRANNQVRYSASPATTNGAQKNYSNDYERKVAEYEESRACFKKCQVRIPGGWNPRTGSFPGGFDNSACGHCTSVPKPPPCDSVSNLSVC